ncbi:hypothetical protein Tco_1110471 [Tanacetum coccineum]|uniref:Uncharacterized protein n=1 Tax=Tanacetum coccineum TaxID=301880 RepID=A0ABQ5ILB7_9ASTR
MGVFRGVQKVRALGANGVVKGSTIGVVWFEVSGGMVSAKVYKGDKEDMFAGILLIRWAEVGSCSQWDQECSYSRDHFPLLGLEEVSLMRWRWRELELVDVAFCPWI